MTLEFRDEPYVMGAIPNWMLNDHMREVGSLPKLTVRPQPDWPFYMAEQDAGRLIFLSARDPIRDHELVGYQVILLMRHPHYQHILVATGDLHYLMPAYRGEGNGKRLLQEGERIAFERGARMFLLRTKAKRTSHGPLFESMGYELSDLVYVKDLTQDNSNVAKIDLATAR